MRTTIAFVTFAACAMSIAAAAEIPKTAAPMTFSQWRDQAAKHWKTAGEYTIAIAEQMPAESYGFKPVPAEMSFAEQMVHICGANNIFFSMLTGQKPPADKPATMDKDDVLKFLKATFDWSNAQFASLTADQVTKIYHSEGQDMSGADLLELASNHTTHHRGQCIVYLRLKGITPTDYQF
jgi:uncharacterized damage-inducible protein DinB